MVTQRPRQATTQHPDAAWRVFAAVPVSDAVRALMRDTERQLAPRGWPLRWVRPDLAHLTLRFYGATDPARLPGLAARLASVAAAGRPLRLRTTTIGAFPSDRRPRVVWLGLGGDIAPLAALAAQVASASAGDGPPGDRPFAPHITLARLRDSAPAPEGFAAATSALRLPEVGFAVERLQLIRSVLGPGGPAYTTIGEWPLGHAVALDDHG